MRSFQHYFASNVQREFGLPVKINMNRVQKQQIRIIHKASSTECYLLFDNDVSVIKAAKIILNVITMKPICLYSSFFFKKKRTKRNIYFIYKNCFYDLFVLLGRQLIGYIRAWQNVINNLAKQNGSSAFTFNTYIISVLVIFFLQMNYDLPTINDITILMGNGQSESIPNPKSFEDKKHFNRILSDFFHFYGSRYEINNHLISVCVGRWQEQRLTGQQKHFTVEQKR